MMIARHPKTRAWARSGREPVQAATARHPCGTSASCPQAAPAAVQLPQPREFGTFGAGSQPVRLQSPSWLKVPVKARLEGEGRGRGGGVGGGDAWMASSVVGTMRCCLACWHLSTAGSRPSSPPPPPGWSRFPRDSRRGSRRLAFRTHVRAGRPGAQLRSDPARTRGPG